MSDVEWDSEDYVPTPPAPSRVVTDKWDGEDEEEEVKESWEDDDENKDSEVADAAPTTVIKKKKKKLSEIIAEKEKKKQEELERRQKAKEEEMKANTPEEILAEKLRIQKIQEDADLQLATELVGDKPSSEQEVTSLDSFNLSTSSGLDEFRLSLLQKLKSIDHLEKRQFYITFLESLCRDLCENLEADSIKRITNILNVLYNEKLKASKPSKGKKKATGKAKLNKGQGVEADFNNYDYEAYGYDEYDDFI